MRWAALALVLLLSGCRLAAPSGAPSLVRIAWTDVGVPTPFRISTAGPGGAVLLSLIYDTLTWKDDLGVVPWLATAWDVAPDGLSVTFTLAHDVRWQDGQPLTVDDVAFTFQYLAAHPYRWMPTDMVAAAAVTDSDRVRLDLTHPYPPFIEEVAGSVPILARHIWANVADPVQYDGADASIGSGPYRLVDYRAADGAYRLVANTTYFRGKPRIDEIQQLNLPTETLVQSVQQGQADLAWTTDASVVGAFPGNSRLKVFPSAPLSVVRLVLNTERPPVDRVEVRRALGYAVDRAVLARAVTRGEPVVGSAGVIPPETPWFSPTVQQYGYDPVLARQLLGGQQVVLDMLANPEYREPELIAPMLNAVGIKLQVQRVDGATKAALLRDKRFVAAELQHIGIGGDPDYLRRWYSGSEANLSSQGDVLHSATFDALAAQQAVTLDPAARRALVAKMQDVLAQEVPTIPLFYRRFYWMYDSSKIQPMNTWSGLMNGIPFVDNKLIFLQR